MKMLVDVELAEVPINAMPLIDDGDFKTIETAVAFNAAGLALKWNFVTVDGVYTQTPVVPTNASPSTDYAWGNVGGGMYAIDIPASGGAWANNDTEGFGWFTGVATGILPWAGPVIQFSPANVVNSLVPGTDLLQVDTRELAGGTQSATDLKDFADDGYDPSTNKVQGVVLVDTTTTLTNAPSDSSGVTTLLSRVGTPSDLGGGATVAANLSDIEEQTDDIGVAGAGLTAITGLIGALNTAASSGDPGTTTTLVAYLKQLVNTLEGSAGIPTFPSAAAPGNAVSLAEAIRSIHANIGTPSDLGSGATIKDNLIDIESQTDDIGTAGAGLNNIPWNSAWDAEVQSEVDDALVAQRLDELVNADSDIDGAQPPAVGSVFHELMSKTAGSFTFDQTTDSQEAIRDRGDAAWTTATGFSTHSAADVWAVTTRRLSSAGIQDIWDALTSNLTTVSSIGKLLVDNVNATISSRASQTSVDDLPTNAELATALAAADDAVLAAIAALNNLSQANIRTAIGLASANLDTQLDALPTNSELTTALAAADDAVLAAIAALNNLAAGAAMTLTAAERNSIADALLDRSNGVETSLTPRGALRLITSALAGKLTGAATTTVTIRNVGDSKDRITATVDADGNRSAVTTDAT